MPNFSLKARPGWARQPPALRGHHCPLGGGLRWATEAPFPSPGAFAPPVPSAWNTAPAPAPPQSPAVHLVIFPQPPDLCTVGPQENLL